MELSNWWKVSSFTTGEVEVSSTKKGRAQDRARVACGQDHEVRYKPKKRAL